MAHIFKAVIATGLKLGMTILQSLDYTRCKFCALPLSSLGMAIASVTWSKTGCFMSHVGAPPFQVRKWLYFLTFDFFSRRAGIPINKD